MPPTRCRWLACLSWRRPRPARRALPELGLGAALGVGFIAASVGIVTLLGGYRFEWTPESATTVVFPIVTMALGAAVLEELLFRGLALQAIEASVLPVVVAAHRPGSIVALRSRARRDEGVDPT